MDVYVCLVVSIVNNNIAVHKLQLAPAQNSPATKAGSPSQSAAAANFRAVTPLM